MRTILGTAMVIGLATFSSGCAAVLVGTGDAYHRESAYLYGRFVLDSESGQAMAFSIRCRDGHRYKIVFSKEKEERLRMTRLSPGVCQLDDIVYKGVASQREMSSLRLLGNEHLEAGGVYYVGDFDASASSSASDLRVDLEHGVHRVYQQTWNLFRPTNNYDYTTAEMKRTFPNFSRAHTENRMPHQ